MASRHLLIAAAALFAALVGLRLHGYSLPIWHALIDGSAPSELLLGKLRPLRSDDWLVGLPLALSQAHQEPPFPRVNRTIGLGQDLVLNDVPSLHWTALFRPFGWGFFLGDDLGVAWMWWSQSLGFALTWFLVLRLAAPGRTSLAAWGALLLWASPFIQFWALLPTRFAAYAGLAVLGATGVLRAGTPRAIAGHALLLAWALGCLGLALYPPYQLPLAQLCVLLVAGLAWDQRERLRDRTGLRLAALAAAGVAVAAVGLGFALDAGSTLERMLGSAYPGERFATGGDLPVWRIFAHDLLLAGRVEDWAPSLNIAEGASFWLFFPVAGLVALRAALRGRPDPLSLALLGYATLLVGYATFGVPAAIARATGLSWAPPSRTLVALGLADAVLLVRQLALPVQDAPGRRFAAGVAAAWVAALAAVAFEAHRSFPEVGVAWLAAACLVNGLLAAGIALRAHGTALVASSACALLASTLWYNPLVLGGSAYLRDNELSHKILAQDRAAGGGTLWVSYGPLYAGNLFRVLGVRALTGLHPVPQLELWRRLDPEGASERIYNRYAHVTARSSGAPGVRFLLPAPDSVEVVVEPGAPELRALGVTHVLIVAPHAPQIAGAAHVDSYAWNHLYRLLPAP